MCSVKSELHFCVPHSTSPSDPHIKQNSQEGRHVFFGPVKTACCQNVFFNSSRTVGINFNSCSERLGASWVPLGPRPTSQKSC